jgi:GDPmannose 4,6-dehydratase
VTRKITRGLAQILAGNQQKLYLGNLYAKRDWGFAPEYVEMMWRLLQQDSPDDYVVGTGESHTVKEFVNEAFAYSGIELEWKGQGVEEKARIKSLDPSCGTNRLRPGDVILEIDPNYFRPTEVGFLQADITKATQKLNWKPRVNFTELVQIMVDHDLKLAGLNPKGEGIDACKKKGFGYTNHEYSLTSRIER